MFGVQQSSGIGKEKMMAIREQSPIAIMRRINAAKDAAKQAKRDAKQQRQSR